MTRERRRLAIDLAALALLTIGVVGCAIGIWTGAAGFFRAWLCAFLVWVGVPLAGVTLVLVHDLTGGEWMNTARPALNAAIVTMPLATLAGVPVLIGIHSLYSWSTATPPLGNSFYLNDLSFVLRSIGYALAWNLLALFALRGPRVGGAPIAPRLSWISALGLIALAFSTGFAAIDWILSVQPHFWSSIFPYAASANWFNTGLALVVLAIAMAGARARREHMTDLARLLFGTTIFWAYVEYMQYLIVWESDLKTEIPWYLVRIAPPWKPLLFFGVSAGFFVPFFLLLWGPTKRSRVIVGLASLLILASCVADKFWMVLPIYSTQAPPIWLDLAALAALGAPVFYLFGWSLRRRMEPRQAWADEHV